MRTLAVLLALVPAVAGSQSPPLTLKDGRVAAGGGRSAGAVFMVSGTIGQHEATPAPAMRGDWRLAGGFDPTPPGERGAKIFRDGFEGR